VLDASAARGPLPALVEACVAAGVDWVQLRERALEGSALLTLCDRVSDAARRGAERRGGNVRVLLNRRADVALAAGADGVHLGGDAMAPADARALLGESAWIGVSTHAPEEIAAVSGASYAHIAPVFAPLSKESARPPLGLAALANASACGLPVLAQGGITPARVRDVVAAGAAGVAVTGSVLAADDPAAAVRALRRALDEASHG
jgi:thiamine-phosphate pyrophosphorylase